MTKTGLTLKSTDHSPSPPEGQVTVSIFPYRTKDGETVEWMLQQIDTARPRGAQIMSSCRICGDYEAALRAAKYVFMLKKRKR